jgi:predicted GIY-YIG superfamily endonuclease
MVVYLLHFDRRYKHAGHYLGSTVNLEVRIYQHQHGRGARLLEVISAAGITFQLARTWPGGKPRERQLKKQGGASRLCPLCGITRTRRVRRPRRHPPGWSAPTGKGDRDDLSGPAPL